jgi:hypothetical protein
MNFIIIGSQRTGSTMLCDYLNKQKDIKCHYELFLNANIELSNNNSEKISINVNHTIKTFFNYTKKITDKTDLKIIYDILTCGVNNTKYSNPDIVLSILSKYNLKSFLGFKLFYYQIDKFTNFSLINYLKNNNIKIIHLYRKNKFLQELSYQKRLQTNISRVQQNEEYINQKINFNIREYYDRSNTHQFQYNLYTDLFNNNKLKVLDVSYEDLSKDKTKTVESIVSFITKNSNFIEIPEESLLIKKMNVYSLYDQIENFDEVYSILKEDPYFLQALG